MDHSAKRPFKEDRLHGDSLLPLAAYWMQIPAAAPVLDCHWHDEAEWFLMLEGEALFQVDTDLYPLRAGEAVFIDGGDIHAAYAQGDQPCRYCALVFDTDFLASAGYDTIQQTYVLPLQEKRCTFPRKLSPEVEWHRTMLAHLRSIMDAYAAQPPGFELAIKGRLLLMLQEIAAPGRGANRSDTSAADTTKVSRLKKAIVFIQDNYRKPIRIRELAELIPMSEGQFCRFFKAMTRKTPVEYINAYRIRQAADLLRRQDRKVSDIALEVGFDNVSYFIKVFRKEMGCAPSAFRKTIAGTDSGRHA